MGDFALGRELSLSEKQLLLIAKAVHQECRLLILDEPTAALSREETKQDEITGAMLGGFRTYLQTKEIQKVAFQRKRENRRKTVRFLR